MLNVAHCSSCGRVFQTNLRNLCKSCSSALDLEWDACESALSRNRKLTTAELSLASGVEIVRLHMLIKDGRISTQRFPNLTYPCEQCRRPIRDSRLCRGCGSVIKEFVRDELKQREQRTAAISFRIRENLA